jgi:hypothetical protein
MKHNLQSFLTASWRAVRGYLLYDPLVRATLARVLS